MSGLRFSTSPLKAFVTACLLTVFIALGVWQLNRAQEKAEIRERVEARLQMTPVEVGSQMLDAERMMFRRATASGRYVAELQILLDNQVHQGRAGYHVLTPLALAGGEMLLLVDRGWIPWGDDRSRIPDLDTPEGRIDVRGRLAAPVKHAITFETESRVFEPVWQNLDLARFSRLTGHPVQGLVLLLSPDAAGGFVRQWPRYEDSWIQRHRGYAVQWFGLAVVLAGVFLFFSVHKQEP